MYLSDYIEVIISLIVGLILHALFLWAQDKLAAFMVNRDHGEGGGFREYFFNALILACCHARFARGGDQCKYLLSAESLSLLLCHF